MYAYVFFGLMITCVFSIIESLKNFRTSSLLKYHFVGLLILQLFANFLSFSNEIGFGYSQIFTINKIVTSILIINILILIVDYSISKYLVLAEFIFVLFYAFFIINGFYFSEIRIGQAFPSEQMKYQAVLSFLQSGIFLFSISFALFRIITKTNGNNLYHKKLRIWSFLILLLLVIGFGPFFYGLYMYNYAGLHSINKIDSRVSLIVGRSVLLLFILLRPRFINEAGLSFETMNYLKNTSQNVSNDSFDFLFYKNHYYLNTEGNLEDFSLKMNLPKAIVSDFVIQKTENTFGELLNQNRISYFKELLKLEKYNEFTIEALSEMSGFNNRRTMYNSFKKYTGTTPTEYIQSLK